MKKISDEHWEYKGFDIYLFPHPKLLGKYEICLGSNFICRSNSLTQAMAIIKDKLK